jgi:hypothetical protein
VLEPALRAALIACPRCAEGVAARKEVIEEDFAAHLLAVLLPFLLVLAVSRLASRIGRKEP